MLAVSRGRNPECTHVQGDMRSLRLDRDFDAVFVHDAIEYMTTEADLAAAIATACVHCRPGGLVLLVPDHVAETFAPSTDCGGTDGDDGRGVRFMDWSFDPDPADTLVRTEYAFVFREPDGAVWHAAESHVLGLFPTSRVAYPEFHALRVGPYWFNCARDAFEPCRPGIEDSAS